MGMLFNSCSKGLALFGAIHLCYTIKAVFQLGFKLLRRKFEFNLHENCFGFRNIYEHPDFPSQPYLVWN